MSLLPRSTAEFQRKEYWENFFAKRNVPFEWYGEYTDLCHVLHKYIKHSNKVLMAGCGNSKLSEDLYDAGFKNIDNVDISAVVIRQMTDRNKSKRPAMQFLQMDLLKMDFADDSFDCVIDKGTLDAIMTDDSAGTVDKVATMIAEIRRVLKNNGRYVCVSLAQGHIVDFIMDTFAAGWLVRLHQVKLADSVGDTRGGIGKALPVFVFIFTKMMTIEGRPALKLYEVVQDQIDKRIRLDSINQIKSHIEDAQQTAIVEHHLKNVHPGESTQIDLWTTESKEPKYTLTVVDQTKTKAKNGQFAIFIVPHGRELDWLFSSDNGRQQLAESAGYERLVIVTLHRWHQYMSLDAVKEEVSAKAVEFLQSTASSTKKQWPILSLGDGLGNRDILFEGSSDCTGAFVVEEVIDEDGSLLRRLVFLSTPHMAQSEAKLVQVKRNKKKKKMELDHSNLAFSFHSAMLTGFVFIQELFQEYAMQGRSNILLVGLGGGLLPTFLYHAMKSARVSVVELDPAMLEVASKWFGFTKDDRMTVHIGDGIEFIHQQAQNMKSSGKGWPMVLLDVDSKQSESALRGPPPTFVTENFLKALRAIIHQRGVLLLNLVCRDEELKQSVIKKFFTLFEVVFSISIPSSVNEVLVCLAQNSPTISGCFAPATNVKPDKTVDNALKKMTICDKTCESLINDMCHRLISESKQTYVKQEILGHLSHITIHQLKNYSTL